MPERAIKNVIAYGDTIMTQERSLITNPTNYQILGIHPKNQTQRIRDSFYDTFMLLLF